MTSGKSRLTAEPERVNPVLPIHVWRSPAGADADLVVVAHLSVYSTIYEHGTGALPNETGGFLLGRVGWDARARAWLVEIDEAVPVEPLTQNPVHFSFGWRDVDRVRSEREEKGKALVGWYHTHPDMGIFLSDTDLDKTHRVLFSEPFQVALVYDPVRSQAGYFFWEGPHVIDASPSAWREFEIALDEDRIPVVPEAAVERAPEPPVEIVVEAPAQGSLSSAVRALNDAAPDTPEATALRARFQEAARSATASVPTVATAGAAQAAAGSNVELPTGAMELTPAAAVPAADDSSGASPRTAVSPVLVSPPASFSSSEGSTVRAGAVPRAGIDRTGFITGVAIGAGASLLVLLVYLLMK